MLHRMPDSISDGIVTFAGLIHSFHSLLFHEIAQIAVVSGVYSEANRGLRNVRLLFDKGLDNNKKV